MVARIVFVFTDLPQPFVHLLSDTGCVFVLSFTLLRLVGLVQLSGLIRKSLVAPIGLTKVYAQPKRSLTTNSQISYTADTDHQKIAKIDRENEVAPPPKVSASVGKVQTFHPVRGPVFDSFTQAIQQARMEKGLSQKDCAQKINEKPSVLQDYESGKAIPNAQILSKLERVLGVKLRGTSLITPSVSHHSRQITGSDVGKKLEGPKKS